MVASVGSVVIDLIAESASFVAGLNRSRADVKKWANDIRGAASGINQTLGLATKAAGAFGIAFGAQQIVSFVKNTIDAAGSLGELAQQIGVTTDTLQVLRFAGSQFGVEAGEMDQAIARLTASIGDANAGNKAMLESFNELGVVTVDVAGKSRSTDAVLRDVAEALSKEADASKRARLEKDLLGRAGQRLDPILSQGAEGLSEVEAAARKLGVVLSAETIKKMDDASDTIAAANQVFLSWAAEGIAAVITGLIGAGKAVSGFIEDLRPLAEEFDKTASAPFTGEAEQQARDMVKALREEGKSTFEIAKEINRTWAAIPADVQAHLLVMTDVVGQALREIKRITLQEASEIAGVLREIGNVRPSGPLTRPVVRSRFGGTPPVKPEAPPASVNVPPISGTRSGKSEAERKAERIADLIRGIQFDIDQLNRSAVDRQVFANLERLDVERMSKAGKEIEALTRTFYDLSRARSGEKTAVEDFINALGMEQDRLRQTDAERAKAQALIEATAAAQRDYAEGLRETATLTAAEIAMVNETVGVNLRLAEIKERSAEADATAREQMKASIDVAREQDRALKDLAATAGQDLGRGFADAVFGIQRWQDVLVNALQRATDALFDFLLAPKTAGGLGGTDWLGGLIGSLFSSGPDFSAWSMENALPRAGGGNVSPGRAYMVGEEGPELFVPRRMGTIVPNGGGQNGTFIFDFRGAEQGVEARVRPMIEAAKRDTFHAVFNAIERGGSAARAVGRRR